MPGNNPPLNKKAFPILPLLIALVAVGVLGAAGGFAFAATQEQHDSFCASCHTQPESTFLQRSTAAQPTDLASFHTGQQVNCINCHSGAGITGRMQAEMMGARNALKWYTGTAVQPAALRTPIGDQNCLKCHQDVTQRGFTPKEQIAIPGGRGGEGEGDEEGGGSHWHRFMTRWQSSDANAGTCVSCHAGHNINASAQAGFMEDSSVRATCEACHQVLRRGRD